MLKAGNILPPPLTVLTEEGLQECMEEMRGSEWIAYDTESTGLRRPKDLALFLALSNGTSRYCIGPEYIMHPLVTELLEDPTKKFIAHNANFDAWMMHNKGSKIYKTPGRVYDTAVMHLLYDDLASHRLDFVAEQVAGIYKYSFSTAFPEMEKGKPGEALLKVWSEDKERVSHYASLDAYATYKVFFALQKLLQARPISDTESVWDYYVKYELPFTDVLLQMELTGVLADNEALEELVPITEERAYELRKWFTKEAGRMVSPTGARINELFFDKLKLPVIKRSELTKKPSLDKETLGEWVKMGFEHAKKLLEWRQAEDLSTRYLANLRNLISTKTGRIHTTFNQHIVKTGRLSCVSGATLLHTTRGSFRFDEYAPHVGDRVRTHTGALKPILRKVYKGIDKMFRVCLDNGAALECTADHRVLTASGWVRVGNLTPGDSVRTYNVSVEALYAEPGERASCPGHIPGGRPTNARGDCKAALHDVPKCTVCGKHALVHGEGEGRAGFEVFPIQDGCCQPHAGEDGKRTPQLEGGVQRWLRIPDLPREQEEGVRAPGSIRGDAGNRGRGSPPGTRGSPHQRGPRGQQAGQPGDGHERGPSTHPHEGETGTVVEITPLGTMGVWTVEVAEDHSYATHGFFSKNSSDPNLQNQPKHIRVVFIAAPGKIFHVMDYGQVEWRITAHLSQDERMMADIFAGKDAHSSTAAAMFGVSYDEVMEAKDIEDDSALTEHQKKLLKLRSFAKTLNFGILYGEGPMKLAGQLGISKEEAIKLLQRFRDTYPGLHRYFRKVIARAKKLGYCQTLLGRPRLLPNLSSTNRAKAASDERRAKNSPIQGTAADIIKAAMLALSKDPFFTSGRAKIVLQVHDELVIEIDEELRYDEAYNRAVEWHMLNPLGMNTLCVPLTIDQAFAYNWRDGK